MPKDEVHILIVDDHPIMRRGLKILFENEGFVVSEAEDERSALAAIARHSFHLVVLDMVLREGDCLTAIAKFHAARPGIAVLVYSGSDETHHAERALQHGALGYVMKGGKIGDVVDAARRILEGGVYLSERMRKLRSEKSVR